MIHRNALQPDYRLKWYTIRRVLGQGGFGITYLAYDRNLDHSVAVKEYLPIELAVREGDQSVHPTTRDGESVFRWGLCRFIEEARTLARFDHPNVVRVLSVFEANNTAYMVMRLEQGLTLHEMLTTRGRLEESEILALLIPLLGALTEVHEKGFIHRDIKPQNILIRDDASPVLLDFGSARQSLRSRDRTLTSLVSPGYSPIEQYYKSTDEQGPWSDIYGLGAVLFRCVTGEAPTDAVDRSRHIGDVDSPDPMSSWRQQVVGFSSRFLAAIDCAIEFKPQTRPASLAEWRSMFDIPDDTPTVVNPASSGILSQAKDASPPSGSATAATDARAISQWRWGFVAAIVFAGALVIAYFMLFRASVVPTAATLTNSGAGARFQTQPLQVPPNALNGTLWSTTFGELQLLRLENGTVRGAYPEYAGELQGTFSDGSLTGTWRESDSEVQCKTQRFGSRHWGTFEFYFDGGLQFFEGTWGYCEKARDQNWKGRQLRN